MKDRPGSQVPITVRAVSREAIRTRPDTVATEEPLEIRLQAGGDRRTVAVTMRTPGADFELAGGFLYGEGVIDARSGVVSVRYCTDPDVDTTQQYNVVTVDLAAGSLPDLGSLDRHFYTTSACGVCGKASLEAIEDLGGPPIGDGPILSTDVVLSLP
ncbi:MAG: formate dehydrogenase accessory sulfurtransferase FdhD, partial [Actinomycetota bacterium]